MSASIRRTLAQLDAWKADAQSAKASSDVELRKAFAGVFTVDAAKAALKDGEADKAPIRIRISTAGRDRDRDTLDPKGWELDDYKKNPVVLWAHDYRSFPIAKDTGLEIDKDGLVGNPVFASAEENPWAPHCERLIRGGFLNAASVGFSPMEWTYNEEERGVDFKRQALLEYSIVPVPANAGALVEARSLGIDIKWIADWAEQALDEYHGASGLYIPRATIEEARKIAGRKGLTLLVPKGTAYDVLLLADAPESEDPAKGSTGAKTDPPTPKAPAPKETPAAKGDEGVDADADDTTSDDEAAIELSDDAADDDDDTIDLDADELRGMVQDLMKSELGPRLTALTGRID